MRPYTGCAPGCKEKSAARRLRCRPHKRAARAGLISPWIPVRQGSSRGRRQSDDLRSTSSHRRPADGTSGLGKLPLRRRQVSPFGHIREFLSLPLLAMPQGYRLGPCREPVFLRRVDQLARGGGQGEDVHPPPYTPREELLHGLRVCPPDGSDGGALVVPAGSLDSEPTLAPTAHICCADRARWTDGMDAAPKFDGLPR